MTWKKELIKILREDRRLRVFSPSLLHQVMQENDVMVSRRHLTNIITDWSDLGILKKITHGVFINNQAKPVVIVDEATPLIRKNSVVSLQRVLTQSGIINNPTNWVTAVMPTATGVSGGLVEGDFATFHFSTISSNFFPSIDSDIYKDAYDLSSPHPQFTPEKALLDWIYLASLSNGHARSLPPKWDIDMDMLDLDKMRKMADFFDLEKQLNSWIDGPAVPKLKIKKSISNLAAKTSFTPL